MVKTYWEKQINVLKNIDDGNKRIAAVVFLYFIDKNQALFLNGEKVIADHTLASLTIMIAESKPKEKEMIIAFIRNCIKQ